MNLGEKIRGLLRKPGFLVLLLVGAGFGIIASVVFDTTLHYTSSNEFCRNCHEGNVFKEWQESAHHTNRTGTVVDCAACHIPEEFIPKLTAKVMALGDVWAHFQGNIDTPEKFEARRLHLAKTVWARMAARQDKECRNCHVTEAMMNPDKPANKKIHLAADKEGQPCSDCHEGVAHKPPIHPEEDE